VTSTCRKLHLVWICGKFINVCARGLNEFYAKPDIPFYSANRAFVLRRLSHLVVGAQLWPSFDNNLKLHSNNSGLTRQLTSNMQRILHFATWLLMTNFLVNSCEVDLALIKNLENRTRECWLLLSIIIHTIYFYLSWKKIKQLYVYQLRKTEISHKMRKKEILDLH